jgi:hypothetical protein
MQFKDGLMENKSNSVPILVRNIPINWHPDLSVFASESFLKTVGDEYGWIGGEDASGKLLCILPYTIIHKAMFRMVRFRVETISIGEGLGIEEEKEFLNRVVEYFRALGADIIIPATTNTVFRTYPDEGAAAPYGSYIIDLSQTEDALWQNIHRSTRKNIRTAQNSNICIRSGIEYLEMTYMLVRDTFKRSKLPFMSYDSFKRYVHGLGDNGKIMAAFNQDNLQSAGVYAFSNYCAYIVYQGNVEEQSLGVGKLLDWEAICFFKRLGVRRYDLVGARIDPEIGSKQERINSAKRRFGAELKRGYIWKCQLRPLRSLAYSLAVRLLRGGDIVDHERHKLQSR